MNFATTYCQCMCTELYASNGTLCTETETIEVKNPTYRVLVLSHDKYSVTSSR